MAAATRGLVSLVHYSGPPHVGGVEKTIGAQARFLAGQGYPVRIVSGKAGPPGMGIGNVVDPLFASRGPEIEEVNRELNRGVVSPRFDALVDRIGARLEAALAGSSVVIAHNVVTLHKNLALTAALGRLHDEGVLPPLVAWCHDFASTDATYASDLHEGYPWSLLCVPWADVRYVVVSAERQRQLAALIGVPEGRITVIPAGLDLSAFLKLEPFTSSLAERLDLLVADPLLLLPARITRRKHVERAIEITAALGQRGMEPRLVVSGPPGPHNPANDAYLATLLRVAEEMGVRESVTFLGAEAGAVSDAVMADLFRLADALLLTSTAEGFGIPLLEAGLSSLPIFCSDLPALREIAADAAVWFGPEDTAASIAGRIVQVLRRDPRYALKRRVRCDYTWSVVCERHLLPLLHALQER